MNNQETDTRNYINEIAEKLWGGHAAAMVGMSSIFFENRCFFSKKMPIHSIFTCF